MVDCGHLQLVFKGWLSKYTKLFDLFKAGSVSQRSAQCKIMLMVVSTTGRFSETTSDVVFYIALMSLVSLCFVSEEDWDTKLLKVVCFFQTAGTLFNERKL